MFDDAKALAQLGFRYAEPSQPQAFVTATAASMPLYRPAAWLSGPSLLEGAGGPPTLRQLLGGMTPRAAMVEVCAKEVAPKAPLSEQIYGTRYGRLPIEMPLRATSADLAASWGIRYGRQPIEGEVAAWEAAPLLPELSLPRPNPFIPKRLAIKAYLPISPHISPHLPFSPYLPSGSPSRLALDTSLDVPRHATTRPRHAHDTPTTRPRHAHDTPTTRSHRLAVAGATDVAAQGGRAKPDPVAAARRRRLLRLEAAYRPLSSN